MRSLVFIAISVLFATVACQFLYPQRVGERFHPQSNGHTKIELDPPSNLTKSPELKGGRYSGYVPVMKESEKAKLFYLFYEAKWYDSNNRTKIPIVIWLQGGPGVSSLIGAFQGIGPYYLVDQGGDNFKEVERQYSWAHRFHTLFFDHPIGTGYSNYESIDQIPDTLDKVATQFMYALKELLTKKLTDYRETPIYIFGQDIVGQFVTAIAKKILDTNPTAEFKFNLKGIGIGNGWMDPTNQLSDNGLFASAMGLVNDEERQEVERLQLAASRLVEQRSFPEALNQYNEMINVIQKAAGGCSEFNYREFFNYRFDWMENYFNKGQVKNDYNADKNMSTSNFIVYGRFKKIIMDSVADQLSEVLEKIPVLLFNGQDDIMINTPSSLNWISQLKWSGAAQFNSVPFSTWQHSGQVLGLLKNVGTLTYMIVNQAGAFVAVDMEESAARMAEYFILDIKPITEDRVQERSMRGL